MVAHVQRPARRVARAMQAPLARPVRAARDSHAPRGVLLLMLVLGTLAAALAGCEPAPPPAAERCDVVRPTFRFAIDVPDGWAWTDLAGDVVLEIVRVPADDAAAPAPDEAPAASAPGQAPAAPAADAAADGPDFADDAARRHRARTQAVVHVAVVDRGDLSLDAWADQAVASSRELQRDLEVLAREPARLSDGRPALRLVLKNPRGLEPFIQEMRLAVTEGRAYAVIATAPESKAAEAREAFDHCFSTFIAW